MKTLETDEVKLSFDSRGDFTLPTKKLDEIFKGHLAMIFAKCQARAMSRFFSGSGRHIVVEINHNTYRVVYDLCKTRDGVKEDYLFEVAQNCNSGTMKWKDCCRFNIND